MKKYHFTYIEPRELRKIKLCFKWTFYDHFEFFTTWTYKFLLLAFRKYSLIQALLMVPSQALITLNVLDVFFMKIFLVSAALEYTINVLRTSQLKLSEFYFFVYFFCIVKFLDGRTKTLDIGANFAVKEWTIWVVLDDSIVIPCLLCRALIRFPRTVHMSVIVAIGKAFLKKTCFSAYFTFGFCVFFLIWFVLDKGEL